MNQLARIDSPSLVPAINWSERQLATIKRTVAKDTNDDEFNLFIEYCKVKQLDPFSRQVIAVIFNKDNAAKRQMTIITTQEGLRVMAARCGDYRPAEKEPEYEYDPSLKGPANPLGIVKCAVTLWKQDDAGKWWPVNGTAYWDEFAPVKTSDDAYDWVGTGEYWPDKDGNPTNREKKRKTLKQGADLAKFQTLDDGLWKKMGRIMIAKCATSQALRAGWPATFSGVYGEEEMDRARVADLDASELVAMEAEERRAKAVGMSNDEYPFVDDQGNLHFIPAGKYGDSLLEEARRCANPQQVQAMVVRNREGFNRFWAKHKDDALQVKRELEQIGQQKAKAAMAATVSA